MDPAWNRREAKEMESRVGSGGLKEGIGLYRLSGWGFGGQSQLVKDYGNDCGIFDGADKPRRAHRPSMQAHSSRFDMNRVRLPKGLKASLFVRGVRLGYQLLGEILLITFRKLKSIHQLYFTRSMTRAARCGRICQDINNEKSAELFYRGFTLEFLPIP